MRLEAMRGDAEAELALVGGDRLHQCRFAHDAEAGLHRRILQKIEQASHADAADLLVIGEGEIDRRLQRCAPRPSRPRRRQQAMKPFMSAVPRP